MKATDHFPVLLFIIFCKVLQTFEFVDEILKCDHSNESYWAVLYYGTIHYALLLQTFEFADEILKCDHSNENNTFVWYCLLYWIRWLELLISRTKCDIQLKFLFGVPFVMHGEVVLTSDSAAKMPGVIR